MPSLSTFTLLPNEKWPALIDRLLAGTNTERETARTTMWVEVDHFVLRCARLPIGKLNDDDDALRDIAVRVMKRLERNNYQHIRTWRMKQGEPRAQRWWRYIDTVAYSVSVDYARTSRQNLAPRGEPYRWAREVLVDPEVFDFISHARSAELVGYLTRLVELTGGSAPEQSTIPLRFPDHTITGKEK